MQFVRIFAPALKPALAGSALLAAAAGGWFAIDRFQDSSQTPFERIQDGGPRLLISEFGDGTDTIVAVDPDDTQDRTNVARISHASGYGIFASLSPDGSAIAYTALPEDESQPSPATPAIAGIVEADGGTHVLANDADLLITPVWRPDSGAVVVRSSTSHEGSAGTFALVLLGRDGTRAELASRDGTALFPVGFSPDGQRFYFATLDASGSDLFSVTASGSGETKIAHLADEIARDWKLSPDGAAVAYTVAESGQHPRIVTMAVDLATATISEAVDGADQRIEFSPAWQPDGKLTIASVNRDGGGDAVSVEDGATEAITRSDTSVDLPLQWAPDGSALVVRSVDDPTLQQSGGSKLDVVGAGGERRSVSDSPDALFVGWLE